MTVFSLKDLENIIQKNAQLNSESSYTARLLQAGLERCSQKFGEESVELIIASIKKNNLNEVLNEAADVMYHYLVLLHALGLSINDIENTLAERTHQSGIDEKKNR